MKYIVLNEEYRTCQFGYSTDNGIEESEFLILSENEELFYCDSGKQFDRGPARDVLFEKDDEGKWRQTDVDEIIGSCEFKELDEEN